MSKKWITFLVAAVIGALLLPTAALATCRVDVITTLAVTDATTASFLGDPVPLPTGDKVTKIAPTYGGAVNANLINAEGLAERVQDILVTDDGAAPVCFGDGAVPTGNSLTFSINALVSNPSPGAGVPTAPANIDVYDSNGIGGLGVTASSAIAIGGGNTQQTNITVTVTHTGTVGDLLAGATGAAYRIKNLRIDATSVSGGTANWSVAIAVNNNLMLAPVAFGNSGAAGLAGTTNATLVVTGTAMVATGVGTQNSGSGLTGIFGQTPNLQEAANGLFRLAGAACTTSQASAGTWALAASANTCRSGVANDIATVATSLAFALSGIPSGVTVTFPSTMTTSGAAGGGPSLTWTSTTRGGSPLAFTGATGSGAQAVVYDTTTNQSGAQATGVNIETADNADPGTPTGNATTGTSNPNCVVSSGSVIGNNVGSPGGAFNCDPFPKIGVFVGNPSGQGTATMRVAFGRGSSARFTGDDVAATGTYPVYTGSKRELTKSSAANYFIINPTRTTLLYPYVTTAGGFNTGVAVANTCTDTGVFNKSSGAPTTTPTCSTAGGITFFFIGVNAATGAAYSASLNTDLTTGGVAIPAASCPQANLDSNGRLVAGKTFACGASALLGLISGAPATFTGYLMAVVNSNDGHGFSAQFNAAGAPYAANSALVLESASGKRLGCGAGADCGLGQ